VLTLFTKSVIAGDYEADKVSIQRAETYDTKSFLNLQRSLRALGPLPS